MKDSIVVIFPGTNYTYKEKLLVECALKYEHLGYDVINLDFSSIQYKEIKSLEDAVDKTKRIILEQVKGIIFEDYKDVVFISKSLGTVCANWLEKYLNIIPRQFYLTPLKQTISGIEDTSRVMGMVIGTEDHHLDYKVMESFCLERNIPYLIVKGVGHNLKAAGNELRIEAITKKIVEFC